MRDAARDPAALELLRVQRSRLADRMRWPWWYQSGLAIFWALAFACPFLPHGPHGIRIWPILLAALAVACLMQWGLARATGIKMTAPTLLYPASGRPVRIAMSVGALAALGTEFFLVRHGLTAAAIVAAALAVVAEMAGQQAQLRAIRQDLRGGGGTA
jgi:hypothetical protein